MERLAISRSLEDELGYLDASDDGVALFDGRGQWIGVALSPASYRLLRAAADLAADPERLDQVRIDNQEFISSSDPGRLHGDRRPPEEPEPEFEEVGSRY